MQMLQSDWLSDCALHVSAIGEEMATFFFHVSTVLEENFNANDN